MRIPSKAVLHGIKSSKGDFEGRAFDSTTFHISVDLGESSNGQSMGAVTRPFKLGTSTEMEKWMGFKGKWPLGGIPVDCEFDIVAGADQSSKLTLVSIKPSSTQKAG